MCQSLAMLTLIRRSLAWLWVGIPFAYGVYELMIKVSQLFA